MKKRFLIEKIDKKMLFTRFILIRTMVMTIAFVIGISNVYALDKYVTDDVSIYLRRGPGTQYAFSGSIKSGSKVAELETSQDGKYARIQDSEGRVAWIETSQLSDSPSLQEQVILLKNEITEYKDQIAQLTRTNNDPNQLVNKLQIAEKTIIALQKQVKEQNNQIESMTTQVDEKRQNLIQTWFLYGAGVAGVGLLLGLLLPVIIPKRRHKDRWMR